MATSLSSGTQYQITFPAEMGDVALVNVITTGTSNVTEIVQGVASGSKCAFQIDGTLTSYIDFTTNETGSLQRIINQVFGIQCPVSLLGGNSVSSDIVYSNDFEMCAYDETSVLSNAFCGQCSQTGNTLVVGNTKASNYLCFAYKLANSYVIQIDYTLQINGNTLTTYYQSVPFAPNSDSNWHYICIDLYASLGSQSSTYATASSITVINAYLNRQVRNGIKIDAVSLRNTLPLGYEQPSLYPTIDQSSTSCVFPFTYNGKNRTSCMLDNNDLPICTDANSNVYTCVSSSIESFRRLYPQHQLIYNSL
ncbi:unnamed protein product, partial [Didymodactylos carnosus]